MIGLIIFSGFLLGIVIVIWALTREEKKPEPLPPWHDIYDPSFDSSVEKKKEDLFGPGAATGVLAAIFIFKK